MNKRLVLLIIVLLIIIFGLLTFFLLKNQHKTPNSPFNVSKSAISYVNNKIAIQKNSRYGSYLAEPNGQALYTYNQDSFNKSNCNSGCLKLWPPYLELANNPQGLPINFGVIKSTSGLQYTYKGKPLYTYIEDKVNQTNGQNVGGFILAKP